MVGQRRSRRRTARVYDQQTVAALSKLWRHFGHLCGKRLAATLRLWLPHHEGWDARSKRKIALGRLCEVRLAQRSPVPPGPMTCAPRRHAPGPAAHRLSRLA